MAINIPMPRKSHIMADAPLPRLLVGAQVYTRASRLFNTPQLNFRESL